MAEEKELEGLKREMEALAECLSNMGDDIDSDAVADILHCLVRGDTARSIIDDFGLEAGI